ncbi:endonuclease/exonuclease/phosphatase family protein [Jatrophihabitans telluris]|uniref:Endonuclease/exonuclease/phosphatase family protein n=1 Tax=Jatrophihabitans telluris TaxID=2038343 RepID=A0ABY4QYA0_9ACTN|nr:endonuclease/exonuclease/phosphatase family protein [Jatrophihabitans telluris]UQX87864.1 endonuclease/exonuclease/phosphatase family protein [Jatrophihabitans telluris]
MSKIAEVRPLTLLLWLLMVLPACSLLARNVASSNHVLVLAACAAPFSVIFALPALIVGATSRRWFTLTAAAVLIVLVLLPSALTVLRRSPATAGRPQLRVLSLNMRLGQADPNRLVAEVLSHRVDVLAVQELTGSALTRLQAAGLSRLLPHEFVDPRPGAGGVGLFSRFPLGDERSYTGFNNGVLSASLVAPGLPETHVLSSHLGAPWPQSGTRWFTESRLLTDVLKQIPGPLIDAGDFNATTSLRVLRDLISRTGTADAATQAGAATIRTYPANGPLPPLLGIDHVLLRTLKAGTVRTISVPGTDHRALLVTVVAA